MSVINTNGKISLLRVQRKGSGYGPSQDFIDVEVVVKLAGQEDRAFGFQLRDNDQGPAHRAMLDLIRDAYSAQAPVGIAYEETPGKKHHLVLRVWRN